MSLFLPTETFAYIGVDDKIIHVDGTDVVDKGFWSGSIAYQPNDVIQYQNSLFIAIAASFNQFPTSIRDDSWSIMVRLTEQASSGGTDWLQDAPDVVKCSHIDWGTTAEQVNSGQMPYNATYATVQEALDALFYVPLQVTSFGNTVGVAEVGQSIFANSLSWVYNKTVASQSIDQGIGVLPVDDRSVSIAGTWTTDQAYHLSASDGTNSASATTSLVFRQQRYWGPSSSPAIDDAGVIAFSQEFATSLGQSRTIAASAEYIYFAFPSSFGTPTFTVNGLLNTAWTLTARAFVNASGYSSSYDIWRSNNLLTGTYQIILS
jgi:hypothetical protein